MSNGFSEAPASWNTRYVRPDGFVCQLTLRSEGGADLLPKTDQAIKWLLEHDCEPVGDGYRGNGNGQSKVAPKLENGQPDRAWCPIHGCAMKRHEKNGQVWYSHQAADGSWCKGK